MRLGAVTLDAAGTLFEPVEPVGVTYARVARRHRIVISSDEAERRFRAAMESAPPLAFPDAPPRELADRERAWWSAVVQQTLGAGSAPGFSACFAELYAHYARARAWRVFPEVVDALRALRARGLRLAVVSNFDHRLEALLAGLGLAPFLDGVVLSARAGVAKPAPAIFRMALAGLGVPPVAALHCGDGVAADVEGARAAGLRAALLDRTGRRPPVPPDTIVVTTLGELPVTVDVTNMAH